VFDTDDDLTDEFRDLGSGDDFVATIRAMDVVTVSTPYLAERIKKYTSRKPHVLPNHIDFEWFSKVSRECRRRVPGLTVGLIGTASHYDDWIYPVKALARLAEHNRDVTVVVAGYMPDYLREIGAVELQGVPYHMYPTLMRQFDVVCCSLDPHDEFNKSKSAIKHLEASAAERVLPNGKIGGAVAVCTDMSVYRRTVNHRKNGMLIPNDGWFDTLDELVRDERLRMTLAENGYKWVRKHRDIKEGYKMWARLYRRLADGGNNVRI
jgi:glycosyltransferase involved in cell wall biosynthesis